MNIRPGSAWLGYRRAPEFDGREPDGSVAHLRYVAQMYMAIGGIR